MQKRRERIERWRAERKKKVKLNLRNSQLKTISNNDVFFFQELETMKKDNKSLLTNLQLPSKKWSLENDSDEETPLLNKESKEESIKEEDEEVKDEEMEVEQKVVPDEDEIDPLDAYMAEVSFLNHISHSSFL